LVSFYYFTENNKLLHKLDVLENSYKATIKELTVCYKTIAQNTEQIELLQRKISNIEKGGEASKIFGFIPSDLIANPIVIYGGAATIGCIAIWACTGINIPQVMFDWAVATAKKGLLTLAPDSLKQQDFKFFDSNKNILAVRHPLDGTPDQFWVTPVNQENFSLSLTEVTQSFTDLTMFQSEVTRLLEMNQEKLNEIARLTEVLRVLDGATKDTIAQMAAENSSTIAEALSQFV
jgi:hypothetical protein